MDKGFKEGQKLKAIFWNGSEEVRAKDGIEIEVVMENGQMAGVPWAIVSHPTGEQHKWNLANCDGVEL